MTADGEKGVEKKKKRKKKEKKRKKKGKTTEASIIVCIKVARRATLNDTNGI